MTQYDSCPPGWRHYSSFNLSYSHRDDLNPARVIEIHRDIYTILTDTGLCNAHISGRLYHTADDALDLPVVGDWVLTNGITGDGSSLILEILPRINCLARNRPGKRETPQPLVANVDMLFIVQGLDHDYNPRRLERYIAMGLQSNVTPVILLNKRDLCPDDAENIGEHVSALTGIREVHTLSATDDNDIAFISSYLDGEKSGVFAGSSGSGKSTIINRLLNAQVQKTKEVREDDSRGRHTTTTRHLFVLPGGGIVIDTPGMRELELWEADEILPEVFDDIAELARHCRFSDCAHNGEPGCAVGLAIEEGQIEKGRLTNYHKLQRELEYRDSLVDGKSSHERRMKEKEFGKKCRAIMNEKKKNRDRF